MEYQCCPLLVGLMLLQVAVAYAQITCYAEQKCSGDTIEAESIEQCCLGDGITFVKDSLTCEECIVYGWLDGPIFAGSEQSDVYTLEVGYIKGDKQLSYLGFSVQDISETARKGVANDYMVSSYEVKTNKPSVEIFFSLIVDGIAMEGDETFLLRLVPSDQTTGPLKDNEFILDTIQIVIKDSDTVRIQFSESDYRSREYHGFIPVVVEKSGFLATPVIVRANPVNYTQLTDSGYSFPSEFPRVPQYDPQKPNVAKSYPEERRDFDITPIEVTFGTEDNRKSQQNIPVTIYNDPWNEATEVFVVTLEVVSAVNPEKVIINRHATLCRIVDNDSIKVGFEYPSYTFDEKDEVHSINVVKDDKQVSEQELEYLVEVTHPFLVNYKSASLGTDFATGATSTVSQRFTFPDDQDSNEFRVAIHGDYEPEGTEAFALHVARSLGGVMFENGRYPTTTVYILDDDPIIRVGFEQNITKALETDGSVEVCIRVFNVPDNNLLSFPFDLDLFTIPGTAGLSDYESINSDNNPLETFIDGVVQQCFNVNVTDDFLLERSETFTLQLSKEQEDERLQVHPSVATVEILDNDFVRIGFEKTEYTVEETEGVVSLKVTVLEGELDREVAVVISTDSGSAKHKEDFTRIAPTTLVFNKNTSTTTIEIPIMDDLLPEGIESFEVELKSFSTIPSSEMRINPKSAVVFIRDDDEPPSAPKNDTGIGDPLFAVPLNIRNFDSSDMGSEQPVYLCYQVHGAPKKYYNLVSDECVSVNAHYKQVKKKINIMDKIAIRAVDNSTQSCRDILVSLDQCSVSVDGNEVERRYSENGIRIIRKESSRRVQLSLPNCADQSLVVWVVCGEDDVWDAEEQKFVKEDILRFVILRGLNLQEWSHGIVGQFWNIPITAEPYNGLLSNGAQAEDTYIITVQHPNSSPRSFPGLLFPLTWDRSRHPCLYAGNGQGGPSGLIREPDDSVIQGRYLQYQIKEAFQTEYKHSRFDSSKCVDSTA